MKTIFTSSTAVLRMLTPVLVGLGLVAGNAALAQTTGCTGTDPGGSPATSGLYAQYYSGYFNDNQSYFTATPGITRIDALNNFNTNASFGNLTPTSGGTATNPETFSLRQRGSLRITTAGTYTFYLTADDAAFLWLGNAALTSPAVTTQALINNGGQHSAQTVSASIYLSAGLHNVLIHYGENTGDNRLILDYQGPDAPTRQNVPTNALCTAVQPLRNAPTALRYSPASQTLVVGVAGSSVAPTVTSATTVQYVLANASSLPAGITINAATGVISATSSVANGSYLINVAAINAEGAATFANAYNLIVAPAPPAGCAASRPDGGAASGGLFAEYYRGYFNEDPAYFNNNTPGITRIDAQLNFPTEASWGDLTSTADGTATDADRYSARFRGSLSIATAGAYTLYLTSDDGSRLWLDEAALPSTPVNAQALIDNGGQHPSTTVAVDVVLSAGLHDILVQYGENGGQNRLILEYQNTAAGISRQVIPGSAFCSARSRPLPVTLVSFGAQPTSKGVNVTWATAQETNSDYFVVERSANGSAFEPVARVAAAGTTSKRQQYTVLDRVPLVGLSYYRLHQIDRDGKNAYSPVVAVTTTPSKENKLVVTAAPNPNAGVFVAHIEQSQPLASKLQLLDLQGRVHYEAALPAAVSHEHTVKTSGLPAGLYLLRLTTAAGSTVEKVVIE